jgi:uncharacterized protein YidB (DUF937 family)
MAKNAMPSMVALLGLLAVAGYQNRDKIAEALKGFQNRSSTGPDGAPAQDGLSSILGSLGDLFGGGSNGADASRPAGSGNVLTGGLGDLMDSFRNSGQSETADSWVTMGVPTKGLSPSQVEQAVGAENLAELSQRTGLSHEELLKRLATAIPESVDRLTPGGNIPQSDAEIRDRLTGAA